MTNSRNLAMRDPALAALVGIIGAANFGADFGVEIDDEPMASDFGVEFGVDFGDDYGYEFGDDYGAEQALQAVAAGASGPAVANKLRGAMAPKGATPQMLEVWNKFQQSRQMTAQRERLLEPNKGSSAKIERYAFAINQTLTLGTAASLTMTGQPDTNIRPQRVTINAPAPGFATISEIKVANVSVTVGGIEDAFDYSALGVGQTLDMPTLTPANRATLLGAYTGFVPPGYVGGNSYLFACSFKGPASIVA